MKIMRYLKSIMIGIFSLLVLTVYAASDNVKKAEETPPANPTVTANQPPSPVPTPPNLDVRGYVLMDANTGQILAGKEIDTTMEPASLTKLMTLYQIAAALTAKRITLEDKVNISEKAWRTGGSKMFIKVGDKVPVNDLIQGIAVVSGNDASVAMAEHLAGSEDSFSDLMNSSAKALGMVNTHYTDATGLPDKNHYTTPRDLALLTKAIVNQFPQYYGWYSQKWFQYNGIKQPNRDVLLWRDPSIEGMKTGHTDGAGYCLVSTASRDGMRLIAVIMGAKSTKSRADASLSLLNYGFRFYESKKLFAANTAIKEPRIYFGSTKKIPVGVFRDLFVTLPTGQLSKVKTDVVINQKIKAPIQKGQVLGSINVKLGDKDYFSQPIVALQDDPKGSIWASLRDHVVILFAGLFERT